MINPVTTLPPRSDDAFFAKVMDEVHQREREVKRRRLAQQQTFTLAETAALTGLPVEEIRALTDDGAIDDDRDPNRLSRDEVFTLVLQHAEENNCQAGLDYRAAVREYEEDHEDQAPRLGPWPTPFIGESL
jgi:hypothetical protein